MISDSLFPAELCQRKQWLVWKFEKSDTSSKPRKVPYYTNGNRRTGTQGSESDRAALVDATTACYVANNHGFDGVGFAFLPDDGLIGIDLDGCFNTDDDERHNRAVRIINACNSFTELSPSGNGVHIIVRGTTETFKSNALGIEVFCGRQFFTMTGRLRAGSSLELADINDATLAKLRNTVKPATSTKNKTSTQYLAPAGSAKIESALAYVNPECGYDDWIRIGMAIHAELGESGQAVWDYWSAKSSKYPGEREIASHWRSFGGGTITGGTLFKMAMDGGWRPPRPNQLPDLPVIPRAPVGRVDFETGEIIEDEPPSIDEMLMIDTKAPLTVAQEYLRLRQTKGQQECLQFWKGDWYSWNGMHYQRVSEDWLKSELYQWLSTTFEYVKMMPERVKPHTKLVSEVMNGLKALRYIEVDEPPTWITPPTDGTPASDIIACWNGFLRISTRRIEPARPELFVTAALDFDAKENPPQPTEWLKFLDTIWPNDLQIQGCLAEAIGYMLTDDTSQQKAFMLVGPKRSGKGTMLRIIEALVGRNNKVSPSFNSLGTQFGLQPLIGMRVAMISDARLSHRSDQAAIVENILRITGEDTVSIDRKHREAWNGKLPTRILMATNELPHFSDASSALPSRFIIFRFLRSFIGQEDIGLTDRLLAELPGILMWALDGLQRLRRRGRLIQPESGKDLVQEFDEMSSPISQFIEDCCIVDALATVPVLTLFDRWRAWCVDQGRDHPGTLVGFGKMLQSAQAGIKKTQKRVGVERQRFYEGIRLRTTTDI